MNTLVPARFSSLKGLFSMFRKQTDMANRAAKTLSTRLNLFQDAGEWQYLIGGRPTPAQPVRQDTEAYAELMKSIHALGCQDHPTMFDRAMWAAEQGGYTVSTDLEYLHGKSQLAENSMNTLSSSVHLVGRFKGQLNYPVRVDTYGMYDGVISISNGLMTVMF